MHEINVIGTMNLFAAAGAAGQHGAQRGGEVVDARLRLRATRTRAGSARRRRAAAPARTRVERSPRRGRGLRARLRRGQPARHRQRCCASPTCSAPTSSRRSPRPSRCPLVPSIFGFDPRFQFVARGRRRSGRSCSPSTSDAAGHLQRGRRRPLPWSEVASHLRQARVPLPPRAAPAWSPRRSAPGRPRPAARAAGLLRYGRGVDNRRFKAGRLRATATRRPARSRLRRRPCACAQTVGDTGPPTATTPTSSTFFRHSPAVVPHTASLSLTSAVDDRATGSPSSPSTTPTGATSLSLDHGRRDRRRLRRLEADADVGRGRRHRRRARVLRRRRPRPPRPGQTDRDTAAPACAPSTRASCASPARRCRPSPRSTAPPSARA